MKLKIEAGETLHSLERTFMLLIMLLLSSDFFHSFSEFQNGLIPFFKLFDRTQKNRGRWGSRPPLHLRMASDSREFAFRTVSLCSLFIHSHPHWSVKIAVHAVGGCMVVGIVFYDRSN